MTTPNMPNLNVLQRAIGIFRNSMRNFLVTELEEARGMNVSEAVVEAFEGHRNPRIAKDLRLHLESGKPVQDFIDVFHFERLILFYWNDIFEETIRDKNILEHCRNTLNMRNKAYHPGTSDVETEETRVALFHIHAALGLIHNSKAQGEVQALRETLTSLGAENLGREIGSLAQRLNEQEVTNELLENKIDGAIQSLKELHGIVLGDEEQNGVWYFIDLILNSKIEDIQETIEVLQAENENLRQTLDHLLTTLPDSITNSVLDRLPKVLTDSIVDRLQDSNVNATQDDLASRDEYEDSRLDDEERRKLDPIKELYQRTHARVNLNLSGNARYYCTVETCRFSDGSRRSWYDEDEAREHEQKYEHEVRKLEP